MTHWGAFPLIGLLSEDFFGRSFGENSLETINFGGVLGEASWGGLLGEYYLKRIPWEGFLGEDSPLWVQFIKEDSLWRTCWEVSIKRIPSGGFL